MDLTALGKHAHTAVISWVLGRWAERMAGWCIDWDYLIRGNLFELLRVAILTDIMSRVLEEIRRDPEDRKKLDNYVVGKLKRELAGSPSRIHRGIAQYYKEQHRGVSRWNAYMIGRAASALSSAWEFRLIEQANPNIYDLAETRRNVREGVQRYQYVPGVLQLHEGQNDLSRFVDLCGRLRLQLRWSYTPIVPPRPVLDHELVVAYLSYVCAVDVGTTSKPKDRWLRYHAFFGGLFHDLPEVFTRDVVKPVKHEADIETILKRVEKSWFERRLKPMLPDWLYHELCFFALREFENKTWPPPDWPRHVKRLDSGRDGASHPGRIIEACDKFAGFMEALRSIQFGVSSEDLRASMQDARALLQEGEPDEHSGLSSLYGHYLNAVESGSATMFETPQLPSR